MAKDVRFGTFTNRHNFKFNEDQVSALYLGDNRVWVNELTVTFTFDNMVADTSISAPSITVTGVPGATFSRQVTWTTDDQTFDRFTASACSLSDNGGGLITCVVTGATTGTNRRTRTVTISGMIPNSGITGTATLTGTIITLTGNPGTIPHTDFILGRSVGWNIRPSVNWSGSARINTDTYEPSDPPVITRIEPTPGATNFGTSASVSIGGSGSAGTTFRGAFDEGFGSTTSVTMTISTPETATTVGASQTFTGT